MSRRVHVGVLLAACVLMQVSLKDELTFFGAGPEFTLVCVYLIGLFAGDAKGTLYGAVGGLAIDCMSGGMLGLCASGYGLVGFFAGRLRMLLFEVGFSYGSMGLFFLSLAEGVYASIIVGTLIGGYGIPDMVLKHALPQAAYNMLAGAVFMWVSREDNVLRYRGLSFLKDWELVC